MPMIVLLRDSDFAGGDQGLAFFVQEGRCETAGRSKHESATVCSRGLLPV